MVTKKFLIASFLLVLGLSACTTSSGVSSYGKDTYLVSASNEFDIIFAKKKAVGEAEDYCEAQGRQFMEVKTTTGTYRAEFGHEMQTYDVVFRCVDEDDDEPQRPKMKKKVVIQKR